VQYRNTRQIHKAVEDGHPVERGQGFQKFRNDFNEGECNVIDVRRLEKEIQRVRVIGGQLRESVNENLPRYINYGNEFQPR
jgi:hypothetical protein